MLLRRFTDYILQNRLQAMLVAFIIAFVPVIGSIGIVIATLVTLRKGVFEGALVAVAATMPYLLSYAMYYTPDAVDIGVITIIAVVVSNGLSWMFAVFLRRYPHWGFTIEVAALLGVVAVVCMHLITADTQAWWQGTLTTMLQNIEKAQNTEVSPEARAVIVQTVEALKVYATGFLVASILFNAVVQVLVGRWWQATVFNPGGLSKELHDVRLSYVIGIMFIVVLVLSYLGNASALDSLPVLFLAFFAAGLSVLHYYVASIKSSWVVLMLAYAVIVAVFPASIGIVSLIALVDTIVNFRVRFKRAE